MPSNQCFRKKKCLNERKKRVLVDEQRSQHGLLRQIGMPSTNRAVAGNRFISACVPSVCLVPRPSAGLLLCHLFASSIFILYLFVSLSLPTIARLPALYFYTPYFLSLSFSFSLSFPPSFHSPLTHRSHIILLFLPFILPTDSFISASHSFKTFSVSAPKDLEPRSAIIVLH